MDTIVAQTRLIAQVAASARTPAAEVAVLKALRAQVTQAQSVVASTQQHAKQAAGQVKSLSYGTGDLPQTPADLPADTADENPQHGQDPRYWVDSSKIFSVPEGELPPYGSTQIGPGLYYPFEDSQIHLSPPPPAAKFPLDAAEITSTAPGQLGSYRDQILAEMPDGTRYWAPDPSVGDVGPSSFPAPQMPVDFRDVLHVPEGQKAPRGYHEFLPNWWIPTY
jgi:hypothetical protein